MSEIGDNLKIVSGKHKFESKSIHNIAKIGIIPAHKRNKIVSDMYKR